MTKTLTARMTVVYGNIRASGTPALTTAQARADITKAFEVAKGRHADAIHLTEMVGKWRAIAKPLAKTYGYTMYSSGNETILWRKDIKSGAKVARLLTKGVPHVMMAGYAAAVRLYPLGTKDFPVTVMGTHLAPGWWYRPKSSVIQARLARTQIGKLKSVVAGKFKSKVALILLGDFNNPKSIAFAADPKRQTLLAPISGVMHGYAFNPVGWTVKKVAHGIVPTKDLHTDHPILWAEYDLTREVSTTVKPSPAKPTAIVHLPPSPPFIKARWFGGKQTPRTIVIHGTVSPCVKGGARSVARFFAQRPASGKTSAHYTVDPGEVIQSVGDHSVAYHCGHNQDSIGIELCDPQAGSGARWADANHKAMLARAATLVAELCLAYKIPAVRITPSALVAGKHGICGHVDMSKAFKQSTHVDPGPDFPWTEFIHQVKAEIARLEK